MDEHKADAMTARDVPLLPYAGTSGWSGSDASRDRADREDSDGTTLYRQQRVLRLLDAQGLHGLTWRELATRTGWHHGQASGALSVLHLEGRVARLKARRDRCSVYVLPEWVAMRETAARRQPRYDRLAARLDTIASALEREGHEDCAAAIYRAIEDTQ